MDEEKKIVIVSDGTGKTATRLMDAVLAQYSENDVQFSIEDTYQQVRGRETLDKIVETLDADYLVIYSIICEDLSKYFHERLLERFIPHLNVLEPMLSTMSKFLGVHPDYKPGILQIIDDRYYKKVDAIGFTVEHDDGRGQMIEEADIVLVGVSRTCKTPVSMYMACNFGVKVANIPIVMNSTMEGYLSSRLAPLKNDRVYGLMMHPEVLARVREGRMPFLTRSGTSQVDMRQYYDLGEIRAELRFCREFFNRKGWQMIDVTRRAIEEISAEILTLSNLLE